MMRSLAILLLLAACAKPPDELIEGPWCCRPALIPQATVYCHNPAKLIEIAYYINDTGMDCLK